jgi:hypothetical protein
MIVQPASLGPRSRPRRVLRVVALVAPVVLLVGVIGLGVLGPSPAPPPVPPPAEPAIAVANPTIGPSTAPVEVPAVPVFPATIAGLDVHGVHWTLEARSRGIARGGVLAVAGYFAVGEQPPACPGAGLGIVVPFCERTGILAEGPWSGTTAGETDLPPFHLHPQIPYGVRVPYLAAAGGVDGALPVILLARFDDARAEACIPEGRHCGQELVVERIAWVDGDAFPRTITVDPAVSGGPPGAEVERRGAEATAALARGAYPLLAVLLRPSTLADIDPETAAALPTGALTTDDAVWYVRALHRTGEPTRVDWLVLEADAQRVIASGSIDLRSAFARGVP